MYNSGYFVEYVFYGIETTPDFFSSSFSLFIQDAFENLHWVLFVTIEYLCVKPKTMVDISLSLRNFRIT